MLSDYLTSFLHWQDFFVILHFFSCFFCIITQGFFYTFWFPEHPFWQFPCFGMLLTPGGPMNATIFSLSSQEKRKEILSQQTYFFHFFNCFSLDCRFSESSLSPFPLWHRTGCSSRHRRSAFYHGCSGRCRYRNLLRTAYHLELYPFIKSTSFLFHIELKKA